MGGESDIGTVLSQIVRPTDDDVRTVTIVSEQQKVQVAKVAPASPEEEEAEVNLAECVQDEEVEVEEEVELEEQVDEEVEEEQVDEEVEVEVEEEAAVEVEEAEVKEEAKPTDEESTEFDEEEVVEYKEIEWKGKTYYVDAQNEVYEMDSDGDLVETPIGLWREETKKLVRYTKA